MRAAENRKGVRRHKWIPIAVLAIVMLYLCAHHETAEAGSADLARGLVGRWTFDEGEGTIARDSSGRGNHGTVMGGFSIAPRPVFGHGLIFAIMDHDNPELWAVRPDGNGDVTDSHVVWTMKRGMPSRSSPLLIGDLLFLVNHGGIASCLEARTGELVWKQRVQGKYSASPIYANGRIYLFNEDAVGTVIKPSRRLEVLAVNPLPREQLMASPAVAGRSLFVRTAKHLYRIEESSSN